MVQCRKIELDIILKLVLEAVNIDHGGKFLYIWSNNELTIMLSVLFILPGQHPSRNKISTHYTVNLCRGGQAT